MQAIARQLPSLGPLVRGADPARRSKAWNDSEVTAHHAIIPTTTHTAGGKGLICTPEAAVYDLIARRYIAQFFGPFETIQSELTIDVAGRRFRATGRRMVADGWKAILHAPEPPQQAEDAATSRDDDEPDNASLPPCGPGDPLQAGETTVLSKKTEPPKPFTDASLMQAMCGVAKFVSDPTIKKILSETDGIGTPATRPAIIETLFERGYVERRKGAIVSTVTGRTLIDALPPLATTADMTAVWEAAMRAILERQQPLDAFLGCVETELREFVEQAKARGPIAVGQAPRAASANGSQPGATQRSPSRRTRGAPRSARPRRPVGNRRRGRPPWPRGANSQKRALQERPLRARSVLRHAKTRGGVHPNRCSFWKKAAANDAEGRAPCIADAGVARRDRGRADRPLTEPHKLKRR